MHAHHLKVNHSARGRELRLLVAGRLGPAARPCSGGLHNGHFIPGTNAPPTLATLGTCSRCGTDCTRRDFLRAS